MEGPEKKRPRAEVEDDLAVSGHFIESYEAAMTNATETIQHMEARLNELAAEMDKLTANMNVQEGAKEEALSQGQDSANTIAGHIEAVREEAADLKRKMEAEIEARKMLLKERGQH